MTTVEKRPDQPRPWVNGQLANGRRFIPNVPVVTHAGESKLFYQDLVRDRCVVVQFTSMNGFKDYPVTRNLKNVQRLLGDACGLDVFLFTITSDPITDTPERFSEFAKGFEPSEGWLFLSGEPLAIESIKRALFVHSSVPSADAQPSPGRQSDHESTTIGATETNEPNHHAHEHRDCSAGLMRYGNDAAGLWGSVPTKLDPLLIVQRLDWVRPKTEKPPRMGLSRKGPLRIG